MLSSARLARSVAAVAAAVLLFSGTPGGVTGISPAHAAENAARPLPARFEDWRVELSPVGTDPRILRLSFDSPLLARRISNTVYLPSIYRSTGRALPTVYALHGTVAPVYDSELACSGAALVEPSTVGRELFCGGNAFQDSLFAIAAQLDAMRFVVVSPDTDPADTICETCSWIDGRRSDRLPNARPLTAEPLPADSFLHQELYPLVESLVNVRSDRAGRGVIGFSMGGTAAYLQGMLHPDAYSYVASLSGPYDLTAAPVEAVWTALGYMRDQGYGTRYTDPVWWEQYNPKGIATNLRGAGIHLLASSGDGCLNPASSESPFCQGRWAFAGAGTGGQVEALARQSHEAALSDLAVKRIAVESVMTPGMHGANNAEVFARWIVPGANAIFAAPPRQPDAFTYRSARTDFAIWGYDVHVDRAHDGFLSLQAARRDGRSFTVAGLGAVRLTTPGTFEPGAKYTLVTAGAHERRERTARADGAGRLHLELDATGSPTTVRVRG